MANKLSGIRIPIYLQLIVTYLLILLLVFAILSPVLSRAISLSKHNYLTEAEHALQSSATVLGNTFKEIYTSCRPSWTTTATTSASKSPRATPSPRTRTRACS